jgi:hypothetical protein
MEFEVIVSDGFEHGVVRCQALNQFVFELVNGIHEVVDEVVHESYS